MKTWEIHQKIDENPKEMLGKIFKFKKGVLSKQNNIKIARVVTFGNGSIGLGELGEASWRIKDLTGFEEWEEVKEPMTFMEVVEEVRNNPNIRVSLSYKEKGVLTDSLLFDELLQYLGTDFYKATLAEMFLKGEFYIED